MVASNAATAASNNRKQTKDYSKFCYVMPVIFGTVLCGLLLTVSCNLPLTVSRSYCRTRTQRTSAIYVDKADVIEDILADSVISSYHGGPGVGRRGTRRAKDQGDVNSTPSFNESSTSSALSIQERMIKEQMLNRNKQTDAATKMNIQKAMQSRILKQEKEFNKLCTNISDAKAFLAQVDKNLELHEETNRNKTRRQFEDWNTNVHGNIQIKISKQINDIDSKSLNQKKNEDYSKFLEITNRKSAIFRDIIIESECKPHSIKLVTYPSYPHLI